MAEARSISQLGGEFTAGTRVLLSVDDDGLHIRTDVTIPPPRELARRFVAWTKRVYRGFIYSFFPFGPLFIFGMATLVTAVVVNSEPTSWVRSGRLASLVWAVSERMPWWPGVSLPVRIGILAAETAVVLLFLLAFAQRWLLKLLLTDKSWLYNARSPGLWNKLWFILVRALTRRRPFIYSFQSSLPKLPVPKLQDTVERYLESASLLQSKEEFEQTEKLARAFLANEGSKLQWYLNLKSWLSPNYVTDWWERFVYLRGRSSLAVNSNYYVLDQARKHPTTVQEARAAVLIFNFLRYREMLASETIEPTMAGDGTVPLCMWQFERMFGTSRIPGRECDEIKTWEDSKHIVVLCKGSFYRLNCYRKDGFLRAPDELEEVLTAIKRDAASRKPRQAEACIPALTAENRTRWAEVREQHFCEGFNNRRSLHTIESALLFVSLADESFETLDWNGRGRYLIGSNTAQPNVWFDKSVNLIVFADGKSGMNCEHAWADAPVCAHLYELAMVIAEHQKAPYDEVTGHVKQGIWGVHSSCSSTAGQTRSGSDDSFSLLQWSLSRDAEDAVMAAVTSLQTLVSDLDLQVTAFTSYGKDFVKKCRVSPDAYLQMAMQLAYFRDQGRFDATYESSMTRLFLHGRTETVRPVTKESCQFVATMLDASATPRDKLKALQKAAARHVRGYCDAMTGHGIDRHLFALYVVSVGKGIESPFLKGALSVPWKLSTSQQPQQQTTLWDIKDPKNAARVSPGGGFGPVNDDGYGVSYMVSGERELFFHVSSKNSSKHTDSKRFAGHLFAALTEMKDILSLAIADENNAAAAAKATGGDAPAVTGKKA